jgi:hypothetical protein
VGLFQCRTTSGFVERQKPTPQKRRRGGAPSSGFLREFERRVGHPPLSKIVLKMTDKQLKDLIEAGKYIEIQRKKE